MAKRLTGQNTLAYIGVEPLTPPNSVEAKRNPEPNDFRSFNIGDMWVNTKTNQAWIFTSKNASGGIWSEIAAAAGGGAENFITDVGTATVDATNITFSGGTLINTDALTPHAVTISLDNGTDGQIIIGATAGSPAYGNLTSTGGTITISDGPNTLNIEANTSGFADHYPTDFGTAQPTAGVLNVLGGDNISTSGASNNVTINLTNGTNGQLLIGGGATAEWQNITSTGHTVVITNGANSINLETASSGANTFTTNSGVATQALNNINIVGANVVTTTGSGSTVTAKLTNGTNGQVIIGGGANPAWATLTSTGGTVTFTPGANTLNLEATGMGAGASTFNTDSGSATEALGAINIFGGELINTSGAAATVGINLDRGTDGQLIIAATGGASAYANLTSTGGSVVITNGPNTINLEATGTGAGASSFPTDSGTATEALGVLGIAGGTNINTSGASNEVTINVSNSPTFSGSVLIQTDLTVQGASSLENGVILGGTLDITDIGSGVMQILGTTAVATNGSDGEILIGGGAAPLWAPITSGDASVVITNGANSIDLSVPAAGSGTKVTQFTSSGTWTKAAGTKMVTVIGWCGGGGGASGGRQAVQAATGGGGGGQGSVFYFTAPAIFFGATETVVIGVGGTGGTGRGTDNVNGNDGNPGTISSFGLIIPAQLANQGSGTPGQSSGGLSGEMYSLGNAVRTISLGSGTQFPVTLNLNGQVTGTGRFRGGGTGGSGLGGFAAGVGGFSNSTGNFYSYLFGTGGGGGGGTNTSASLTSGSAGGNIVAFDAVTLIIAGGTAGVAASPAGGNGSGTTLTGGLMFGGRGGGGGAGQTLVTAPGRGGNGGFPGGGGGGGGGSINGTTSGAGGNGGNGLVIVIEW